MLPEKAGIGFLFRILWCSQSDNHPENNLAKFGYIRDMKVGKTKKKKNRSLLYSWLPSRRYHKTLAIWKLEISWIWAIFFPKKILCIGWNHIFQVEICQKFISWRNTLGKMFKTSHWTLWGSFAMTSNDLHKVLPPNSTYVNAKLSKVKLKIVAYVWMKLDYWYMYFSSWEVASLELDEEWKCVHDKELSWQCLTGQVLSMKYIN